MKRLKETIELSNLTYKKEAIAEAKIKIERDAGNKEAGTRHLECYIYAREWQDYKACITHHFMPYRKQNM